MKANLYKLTAFRLLLITALAIFSAQAYGQRHMENLGRGVVAVRTTSQQVYIGWRKLATDPDNIMFNVYAGTTHVFGPTNFTNYVHTTATNSTYSVRPVINGVEQAASAEATVWSSQYLTVPLQKPADGITRPYSTTNSGVAESYPTGQPYSYTPNDCSVGDLDGDGEYEIIVKWDPTNSRDNSHHGFTGNVYLDAYKLDGTRLWRIDLGHNIRAGAHYTQFIVYDLDSDGIPEIACRTADGTIDGVGTVIGNAAADYRSTSSSSLGRILSGPEYLTVFNGRTGAAMATTTYVPGRDPINGWGSNESYGNRVDRFLAGVGYFDGERPSLLMTRGYYGRSVLVAWDWRNGQLTQRWKFDSSESGNSTYGGQGFHSLSINDVDGDGKDEVVFGSMVIDHDGKGLYTTRLGHGDALHVADIDPDRPGLEVWTCQESPSEYAGMGLRLRDARTGQNIFGISTTGDIGRALAADIDPNHKGMEMWGSISTSDPLRGVYNNKGVRITTSRPSINFAVWWDADLQRELLDGSYNSTTKMNTARIDKWNPGSNNVSNIITLNGQTNNTTKATPNLSADILGDWREEVIVRSNDNTALHIYTTTTPYLSNTTTNPSFYTLMHDPQYRVSIAWQNVGYNQPPHTSFYLGGGMDINVPKPYIRLVGTNITSLKDKTQPEGEQAIFIYPNPYSDNFTITTAGTFSYTVYDQLGRTLESGQGFDKCQAGENLKAGVYMVRIETRNGSRVERVLKQ